MNKDFIRLNLIIFGLLVSLILFVAGVVATEGSVDQSIRSEHGNH